MGETTLEGGIQIGVSGLLSKFPEERVDEDAAVGKGEITK